MLYACAGFLFYFFDVASILQDDYALISFGEASFSVYLTVRSVYTIVTGTGLLASFWLFTCEYVDVKSKTFRMVPPLIFAAASFILLCVSGDNKALRFCYYSCRAVFLFWILFYGAVKFLQTDDKVERQRLGRYRYQCLAIGILAVLMVAEDVIFFLVLNIDTIKLGPIVFSAERNYIENVLMLVCAFMTGHFALRQLNIRSSKAPVLDDSERYHQTPDDLLIYSKRYHLTAREQEVLNCILRDLDNQNIASSLSLAPSTVKVHVHNILHKTGFANRQELIQDFWKTV